MYYAGAAGLEPRLDRRFQGGHGHVVGAEVPVAYDDDHPLIQAVNRLFYAALEVRVRAGAISIMPCPELPLAAALAMHRPHRTAKTKTKAVVARLRPLCEPEVWAEVLGYEAALRAVEESDG